MENIQLKYYLLDASSRKEVSEFIDSLLIRKNKHPQKASAYKNKILNVSVWAENDIAVFEENRKVFGYWEAGEW